MSDAYDVVVIGSGPGGYVAAIRCAQLGLKTACIERESLGGICLNWGCIPTKALLRSAEVLETFHRAQEFGIIAGEVRPDFPAMIQRSRGIADKVSKGVGFLFKKNKIAHLPGTATLLPRPGPWKPHRLKVSLYPLGNEAIILGVLHVVEDLGRAQQRLRGNTTPVEADPAEQLALDDRRIQPELRGADGGDIAAGAAADDHDVGGSVRSHGLRSQCEVRRRAESSRATKSVRRTGPLSGAGRPSRVA